MNLIFIAITVLCSVLVLILLARNIPLLWRLIISRHWMVGSYEPTIFNSSVALCLLTSAVLGTTSLATFCWILTLEERSELRRTLCGILITSRYVIAYILSLTLFFGFMFRALLILYLIVALLPMGVLN